MGRILPANRTACCARNQRRLSKAIRRARALGFMPIWSRHPEIRQNPRFVIEEDSPRVQLFREANSTDFLASIQTVSPRPTICSISEIDIYDKYLDRL